jgi:hypothetical protein
MWIKLDASGIEQRSWMKHKPRRWSWAALKGFDVLNIGFKNSVVTFQDSAKYYWQRLPNVTDLSDEDLAQLLNLWRARALTPAPANT